MGRYADGDGKAIQAWLRMTCSWCGHSKHEGSCTPIQDEIERSEKLRDDKFPARIVLGEPISRETFGCFEDSEFFGRLEDAGVTRLADSDDCPKYRIVLERVE